MAETTASPGYAPEIRSAYTSKKGKNVTPKQRMKNFPSMAKMAGMPPMGAGPGPMPMGGMRKNGAVEAAMPQVQSVVAPNPAAGAGKFGPSMKWGSHHGAGGAAKCLGCDDSEGM